MGRYVEKRLLVLYVLPFTFAFVAVSTRPTGRSSAEIASGGVR
jgi:hypothetical protein